MSRKTIVFIITLLVIFCLSFAVSAEHGHRITDGVTVIEAEHFDLEFPLRTEICNNAARDDAPKINYNVGYITPGDFLQFTVYVETDGLYRFYAWLASRNEDMPGSIVIYIISTDAEPQTQRVGSAEPSQSDGAGWQVWYLETVGEINLTAGSHIIRTEFPFGAVNFDALVVTWVGEVSYGDDEIDETDGGEERLKMVEAERVRVAWEEPSSPLFAPAPWMAVAVIAFAIIAAIIFFAARKRSA